MVTTMNNEKLKSGLFIDIEKINGRTLDVNSEFKQSFIDDF